MLPYGRKNPLPFPYFRSGHLSAICARLRNKGKVGDSQEGGNRRCLPSCPAAGRGTLPPQRRRNSPLRFSEKLSRPSGANTPAAVRVPRSAGAEKRAARQGRTRLRQFASPGQLVPKNRLRGSRSPRSPYTTKTKKAPLTRCLSLLRICWPLSSSSCRNYRSRRRYYHHRYRRNRSRRCPDRSIPRSG